MNRSSLAALVAFLAPVAACAASVDPTEDPATGVAPAPHESETRAVEAVAREPRAAAAAGQASTAAQAEAPSADFIIRMPFFPDLTVSKDTNQNGPGFLVSNIGRGGAGAFEIAVLAGSDSYDIQSQGIAAGGSAWYPLTWPLQCCQGISVIVNLNNTLTETNYNNDSAFFYNDCETSCQVCNDGSCQCGTGFLVCSNPSSPPSASYCGGHGGVNASLGCQQQ